MIFYKKEGRKYVPVGHDLPRNFEGLYYHQFQKHGSRTTSVSYWMGSTTKQPVDVQSLVATMKLDEQLSEYLQKIQDPESDEYKTLVADCGGYAKNPPKIYNISPIDLSTAILRKIYQIANA